MKAFNVYLHGKLIDTVFYSKNDKITPAEVRDSLVNHDGYDSRIVVRRAYQNNDFGSAYF